MARQRDGSRRPGFPKITRIEVSEKHFRLRAVLAIGFLVLGIVAIAYGLSSLLNKEAGWQAVEATPSGLSCASDFQLQYDFSEDGSGATAAYRQISQLYTKAVEEGYRIFSADLLEDGLHNVAYLNQHVNETVTVEPALYQALQLAAAYDTRAIFLAPAYREYERVFLAESEGEASRYDPTQNPDVMAYIQDIAAFSNSEQDISLEFYDNYQVRLQLSDACLAFTEEYGIEGWVDFSWLKNAFLIDYLAQCLADNGYTNGYLASYDGFTRNLDARGLSYSLNLFNRSGDTVDIPAVLQYDRPISIVFLRNYPLRDADQWHYYGFAEGRILTIFLDAGDGVSKSSLDNLVSYSEGLGCAEVLLKMLPVFVSDSFEENGLAYLARDGVYSVWFEGDTLCYNEPDGAIALREGEIVYTLECVSQ